MSLFTSSLNSIRHLIEEIHENHRHLYEGEIADYIPELTRANPDWFGIAITTVDGRQYLVGDTAIEFTIQSVSKPFIYGLALDAIGPEAVRHKIDVEPSGEAFNSISLKPTTGQPMNPMINAGAIAATGMIPASSAEERFAFILQKFSDLAGCQLTLDDSVYRSESETGFRNRAIGNLMRNFDILEGEVDPILEAYFMQCAILVDSKSLSVMGATLANGGVNPLTGERVLSRASVEKVISVMSTCGMYDYSGNWAFEVGIPAKSGVGGGIIGVLPGQLSVAVFSPLLDPNFNSVRGIATFRDLSQSFGLHLFNRPSLTDYVIRRSYTLAEFQSSHFRPKEAHDILQREGERVRIFELQGDLYFGALERLIHAYLQNFDNMERAVIDLTRIGSIDEATREIVFRFARQGFEKGKRIVLVDPGGIFTEEERRSLVPMAFVYNDCDEALEDAEENLLAQFGARTEATLAVPFEAMDLLQDMETAALDELMALCERRSISAGSTIIKQGTPPLEMYFLSKGTVGVLLPRENGKDFRQVSSFTPGMSFGELGFLQGQIRTADVKAITDVELYALDQKAIGAFRKSHPEGYQTILHNALLSMSDRLLRANREVAALK
ncbi:MAG: glutaminase A [Puniceicoccaceae bacterium]